MYIQAMHAAAVANTAATEAASAIKKKMAESQWLNRILS
jgi:hypothetical protein